MSPGLPRSLILIGGLLVVAWGLVALHRVFREERHDAVAAVEGEREFLLVRVRREIEAVIEEALEASRPRREQARTDPRVAADDLLLWQGGRQRLPRVFEHLAEDAVVDVEVEALFAAVRAGSLEAGAPEEESPWKERRVLIALFRSAVLAGQDTLVQSTFKDLLDHRVRWRIDTVRDLTSMLAIVEFFAAEGDPHPDLMQRLLVEGLTDGRGGRLPALGAQLLDARPRLRRADFEFLAARTLALAATAGADLADVEARVRDERGQELDFDPKWFESSPVLYRGEWFVESRVETDWVGVRVDLSQVATQVLDRLRESTGWDFQMHLSPGEAHGLDEIGVETSISWAMTRLKIENRYRWKTALLGFTALLALGMAGYSVRYQRRRARLVRLQSDFVAAVSHELKTPLASIRLLAETLERRLGDAPAARDYPARMIRAVDGLHFLVDNILSFNRLERADAPVRRQWVALADLLAEVEGLVAESLGRPLVLELKAEPGAMVEADPGLLELVFVNLLRNAALYNEQPSAQVSVELTREDGRQILRVRDNGWGFPTADRVKAFDRFWRGKDPVRPKVAGTGLGLSICRMVVELHGGHIELEQSSGSGSTFRISLPMGSGPPRGPGRQE